jgi:2-oxoglutarate dehydrogenase E2 component (dihydrolipoamide succinyltransferase)
MSSKILYEQEGVSDNQAEIINLFHDDFDRVEDGEVVAEIETSKAVVEVCANRNGFIKNIAKLNETIEVGDVIAMIGESIQELQEEAANIETNVDIQEIRQKTISAKTLKIAKSANISMDTLEKLEINTVEEINAYIKNNNTKKDSTINRDFFAEFNEVNLSKSKLSEIDNLRLAQSKTLPCTCSIILEGFNIELFSKTHNLYFNNIFPVVAEICAHELGTFKNLNGFFHDNKKYLYEDINIGFTIDADGCAQVPVVHNCDRFNKDKIQNVFIELITASITEKITLEQMSRPTFVISDLSSVGDCFFHTPLLAPFTSGILGLALDKKASRLVLTLTYDHQMSAGKEALLFLEAIRSKLLAESDLK